MTKVSVLKVVNPSLGLLLINQAVSGILHSRLPSEVFEIMHGAGGLVLVAVAVLHVILNWSWIKANFFRKKAAEKA